MITPEDLATVHKVYEAMKEIGAEFHNIVQGEYPDITSLCTVDGGEFQVACEVGYSSCSCSGSDYYYHQIPCSYLWETDWQETLREKLFAENILAVEARLMKEKTELLNQLAEEKQLYETLKQKFGE